MIDGLKPYPKYKDSGVPWLGEVPEHWEVRRIKSIFREKDQRNGNRAATLLSLTRSRGILPQTEASNRIASTENLAKYKVCMPGDLVMNRMQAWSGMFAVSTYKGVISPDYSIFEPIEPVVVRYFEELLKTPILVNQFAQRSKGIGSGFNRLYTPEFGSVHIPAPPSSEQAAIQRFANYIDRRNNRYISAKKKLIVLLHEQKQAIIHRAVTRGIEPNAHLRASGVEWIGDLPVHWTVLPLKRLFEPMEYGISESSSDAGTIRVLTMAHVRDGRVDVPASGGVNAVDKRLLLRHDDLLFNRTNSAELVGKVGLFEGANDDVTFASYLVRMRPLMTHDPRYLNYLLNDGTFLLAVRREAIPSLHQSNLNPTRYGRLFVGVPPLREQRLIADHIRNETRRIDCALHSARHELELLREFRTRLISDLVTGKLDVRDAAARLPHEDIDAELPEIDDTAEEIDDADMEMIADDAEA